MIQSRTGAPPLAAMRLLLVVMVLLLLAVSGWAIYEQITSRAPILIWDMHVPWRALRAMFQEGANPYSQQVTLATEMEMLGRPAGISQYEPHLELAYPLYLMVLLGPLTVLPLPVAQALWLTLIEASVLILILLAPQVVAWRPPPWLWGSTALFTLGFYSNLWAIAVGQVSVLVSAVVVLSWWALRREQWVLAGVLLALSTIKPQLVFLFVPGVLAWSIWQRRWSLVLAFGAAMAALVALPLPWLPAWPLAWLEAVKRYGGYSVFEAPLALLLKSSWIAGLAGLLLLAWTVYRWRTAPRGEERARDWALGMLLTTAALLAPRTSHINQLVLLIPLFLVFARLRRPGLVVAAELVLLFGPWAMDLILAPTGLHHSVWQHRVISPILPTSLVVALLCLGPPTARGGSNASLSTNSS